MKYKEITEFYTKYKIKIIGLMLMLPLLILIVRGLYWITPWLVILLVAIILAFIGRVLLED